MIKNYTDDVAMAEYGRQCARFKAIREHKEAIRTIAVSFQNDIDAIGAENLRVAINDHVNALIEVLNIK